MFNFFNLSLSIFWSSKATTVFFLLTGTMNKLNNSVDAARNAETVQAIQGLAKYINFVLAFRLIKFEIGNDIKSLKRYQT
jgi:hypothetical protein